MRCRRWSSSRQGLWTNTVNAAPRRPGHGCRLASVPLTTSRDTVGSALRPGCCTCGRARCRASWRPGRSRARPNHCRGRGRSPRARRRRINLRRSSSRQCRRRQLLSRRLLRLRRPWQAPRRRSGCRLPLLLSARLARIHSGRRETLSSRSQKRSCLSMSIKAVASFPLASTMQPSSRCSAKSALANRACASAL